MSSRCTICILAPLHDCDDIRVFHKQATSLAKGGYRVILIAKADRKLVSNGVEIQPVRYRNRLQRFLLQPWFLYKVLSTQAKIVHLHNPDTLPIGFILKLCGKRVIYDAHENFPLLIPTRHWIPTIFRKPLAMIVGLLERGAGLAFDNILVTQSAQLNIHGRRAVLIGNPPITKSRFVEEAVRLAKEIERGQELRLVYAGSISEDRGLTLMLDVLDRLNRRFTARLWLAGPEAEPGALERARSLPGWRHVDYLGNLSQKDAFSYIASADMGLVLFLNRGDNQLINPNKLFEYQFFGTPFVASDFPDWRGYMMDVEAGVFVDPSSVNEIVEALAELRNNRAKLQVLAENGREFVREQYNWEKESEKLLAVYKHLAEAA